MNCINCKGTAIETDNIRGEEICVDCGYVLVSNVLAEINIGTCPKVPSLHIVERQI